jgi:hypothetical protein
MKSGLLDFIKIVYFQLLHASPVFSNVEGGMLALFGV